MNASRTASNPLLTAPSSESRFEARFVSLVQGIAHSDFMLRMSETGARNVPHALMSGRYSCGPIGVQLSTGALLSIGMGRAESSAPALGAGSFCVTAPAYGAKRVPRTGT
jgi:hypothetical protein